MAITWPIAAGMVKATSHLPSGQSVFSAGPKAWASVLSEFKAIGFANVELHEGWLPFPQFSHDQLADLTAVFDHLDMKAVSVAIARKSVLDPLHGQENLEYSLAGIEAAAKLGASVVCVGLHPSLTTAQREAEYFWLADGLKDSDEPEAWDRAVKSFQQMADRADKNGLELSLEIYEDTLLGTSDTALRLLAEVDRGNVGLNPDIGNIMRLHRPVENWMEMFDLLLPHTNYWHVKNYLREERDGQFFTEPSTMDVGVIDFVAAFEKALEVGFEGIVVCEQYSHDPMPELQHNLNFLIELFDRLGVSAREESLK